MKGQPFYKRLYFALNGLKIAFCRESSFRFHILAAILVYFDLWLTNSSPVWWAIASEIIGLVIMAELFNTALETLIDHLHPEQHPEIGVAKDIAAGAVLVAAFAAILVAIAFIFQWI